MSDFYFYAILAIVFIILVPNFLIWGWISVWNRYKCKAFSAETGSLGIYPQESIVTANTPLGYS